MLGSKDKIITVLATTNSARTQRELAEQRRNAAHMREHAAKQVKIDRFLKDCNATESPISLYATWLSAWILNGGKVNNSSNSQFVDMGWKTPTTDTGLLIPEAYGAQALQLLIFDEIASISRDPSTADKRNGWEWGHGTVLRLYQTSSGLVAETNKPDQVWSYPDVEAYIRNYDALDEPPPKPEYHTPPSTQPKGIEG